MKLHKDLSFESNDLNYYDFIILFPDDSESSSKLAQN